jgi:hypothetical protein
MLRLLRFIAAIMAVGMIAGPTHAHETGGAPDLTHLPIGDGKLSQAPKVGYIWACHVDPNAGGAFRNGPWIHSDGTYDFTQKALVDGDVKWPSHYTITLKGDRRAFTTNDLPNHGTGTFPIAPTDDAYQYDRNPNSIKSQDFDFDLPANPQAADQPGCAPGAVGILLSGAVLFNALDAPGRDAVAHETQDACQGHPQEGGVYHYHSVSTCLEDKRLPDGHSALVGYAVDGFGIFGRYGENGKLLTSADLDACHGHTHAIPWDGKMVVMYHYHATWDFPYTIGCMHGPYSQAVMQKISGFGNGPPRGGRQGQRQGGPDLAAAAAKLGISEDTLRAALGPSPPDLAKTAKTLGVTEEALRAALGVPN